MDYLKIEKSAKTNKSMTRTIRISGETFDKISELTSLSIAELKIIAI